jgi:predicted phosphoribosyltransferase
MELQEEILSKLQMELQVEILSKLQVELQVELQINSLKNSERIKIKTKKKMKFKIRFKKIRMFQLMQHLKLKIMIKKIIKSLKKFRIKKIYSKFSNLKKC